MYRLPRASARAHQLPAAVDGGIPTTTATRVLRRLSGAPGTVRQLPAAAAIDRLPAGTAERLPNTTTGVPTTTTGVQFDPSGQHLPAAAGIRLGLPILSKVGAFASAEHGGPCTAVLPGASRRLVLPSAGDTAPRGQRRGQDAALLPTAGE